MQLPLPFEFKTNLDFASFVQTNNENIIHNLDSLVNNLSDNLFIYGNNYGKTHLLHAYTLLSLIKNLKSIYINLKTDKNLLAHTPDNLDILFIDNLEFANKIEQKQLFDLYNKNNKIVLTAKNNNNNLKILPDLNTRINKGIKLLINPTYDKDKLNIIKHKIELKNLKIDGKTLSYLFNNYSRDLKKLIKFIDLLDKESLVNKNKISPKFIKKIRDHCIKIKY